MLNLVSGKQRLGVSLHQKKILLGKICALLTIWRYGMPVEVSDGLNLKGFAINFHFIRFHDFLNGSTYFTQLHIYSSHLESRNKPKKVYRFSDDRTVELQLHNSNHPDRQLPRSLWEISILLKILINPTNVCILLYCSLFESYTLLLHVLHALL